MKKIIIIGGGISGLSSGIYAQLKGFESIVIEKHLIPGGECTGWDRKGYHIDGCIHWLLGTKEGTYAYKLWQEVGALENTDIYQPDSFFAYNYKGTRIFLYRDLEQLRCHFLEISTDDSILINDFCDDLQALGDGDDLQEKPLDLMNLKDIFEALGTMRKQGKLFQKYGRMTIISFAKQFKHPGIRKMFEGFSPAKDFSIALLMVALGNFSSGNAGIPKGGSKAFALRMGDKYTSLGGKLHCNTSVKKIIIENSIAKGVLLEDNTTLYGDYIISSCDPKVTFTQLLDEKYKDKALELRYNAPETYLLASSVYVSLAIEDILATHPRSECLPIPHFQVNKDSISHLVYTHYRYEEGFAPEGKTVMTIPVNVFGEGAYQYWKKLNQDSTAYYCEKERIGKAVIDGFLIHYPEFAGKVHLLDVATPLTYNRYTGAYLGAYMPFFMTTKSKMMPLHTGKIKGLKNCYLSGQWIVTGGGLPGALLSGKEMIQRICKKEKVKW